MNTGFPGRRTCLLLTVAVLAQACDRRRVSDLVEPIAWLQTHATRVSSVDPSNRDFQDLDPLRSAIGNSRVVLLGEQSHGDGMTFLAKSRLIEFLHQEMGFDVLAFESGMYSVRRAWQDVQAGEGLQDAFGKGVFGIWAGSAEVQPLVAYLAEMAETERPLELAGFDSQLHSAAARASLVQELESFLQEEGAPILDDAAWSTARQVLSSLTESSSGIEERPPPQEQAVFLSMFDELRGWLVNLRTSNDHERRFWLQLVGSTSVHVRGSWARDPDYFGIDAGNHRDEQMAENLLWLINDWYPGRKVMVWAATFHNIRNPSKIDSGQPELDYASIVTMGHRLWEALGDEVYNIGFTAFEGEYGRWMLESAFPLAPATRGSLEDLMARAGLEHAFIDFRGAGPSGQWLSRQLVAKPLGYQEMTADWTSVFDGLFFTRTMTRSTPANPT